MSRFAFVVVLLAGCFESYDPEREPIVWEPAGPSAKQVLAQFQECMTIDSFLTARMWLWSQQFTSSFQPCGDCHGGNGMFSPNDLQFESAMKHDIETLLLLFTFHPAGDGSVIVDERGIAAAGAGSHPLEHPPYSIDPAAMQAASELVRLTNTNVATDRCPER